MTKEASKKASFARRDLLKAAGLGALALAGGTLASTQAMATPEEVGMLIDEITKNKKPTEGKINLDVPEIAENAATVRTTITVDSPMTADNHVKAIHVFGEGNPAPNIVSFNLGPSIPQAKVTTRIRLAQSQNVVAVAVMSDGSSFIAKKEVKVTIGGCGK
ncbi:MAG: thiosulfate oxidation carrier protein SoxY [Magnetospirillum sp. WYHS-4]